MFLGKILLPGLQSLYFYCSALLSKSEVTFFKKIAWIRLHLVALCTTHWPLISVSVSYLRLHRVVQNSITSHSLNHVHRCMCCLCVCRIFLLFLDIKWSASWFWSNCATSDVRLICESAAAILMSHLPSRDH